MGPPKSKKNRFHNLEEHGYDLRCDGVWGMVGAAARARLEALWNPVRDEGELEDDEKHG